MDSFELNKIIGAILGTFLLIMSVNMVSGAFFTPHKPAVPGYDLPAPAEGGATVVQAAAPAETAEPLAVVLAKADVAKGQNAAKKCAACHSFEKGGPNKVGPNLWSVLGGPKAHIAGFGYSNALKERGAKGEKWGYEELNAFIENPKGYIQGTSMAFAGVKSQNERADIIAYLRTLSDSPLSLPQ